VAAATVALASPALAADNDTLTIGFTVSQTGKLNTDSIAQMRGFDLWRDQVNAKGGMKDGKLTKEVIWPAAAKTADIVMN
jgi:ABC-type branched-subunit amino acid transport system substrate-binding protein